MHQECYNARANPLFSIYLAPLTLRSPSRVAVFVAMCAGLGNPETSTLVIYFQDGKVVKK